MLMGIRKSWLFACAFCAVALASAPRMALAQIVELEFSVSGNIYFNNSKYPNREILTEQYPLSTLDLTTGTSISYPANSGTPTYNTYYYQYSHTGFMSYVPVSAAGRAGSNTLPMSKFPEVAFIFDCTNLDLSEVSFSVATPRYLMYVHRPLVLSNNTSVPSSGSLLAVNYIYVLPHGSSRSDASSWVSRTRSSDGFFHIGYSVDAIAFIMCYEESFQSSSVQFSSFDPAFLNFGANELPRLYFNFPNLDGTATSADVAAAASSINGSISSQTSSITSSVNSQTSTLMGTNGASSIFSDQLSDASEGLEVGIFGQLPDIQSDFTDVYSGSDVSGLVHFPGINVLGYQLAPEMDVNVWQNGLLTFAPYVRGITTFIFFVTWFNGMVWVFQHQILGIDLVEGANVGVDISSGGTGSHYRRLGR